MKVWQAWTLAGLFVAAAIILIPAEKEAKLLRQKELEKEKEARKAAWRAHWEKVRPRTWDELPILESPSIVPEMPHLHFDTS